MSKANRDSIALKDHENRLDALETTKLLWSGVAAAGETITLNETYTKYKTLHVVIGNNDRDFGGALLGSTIDTVSEIHCVKVWLDNTLSMQVHGVSFNVVDSKHLTVMNAAYKMIASKGTNSTSNVSSCYVRRIYASY